MLRGVALSRAGKLTARARGNAYPSFSAGRGVCWYEAPTHREPVLRRPEPTYGHFGRGQTGLSVFGEGPLEDACHLCRSLTEEVELHALGAHMRIASAGSLTNAPAAHERGEGIPEILDIPNRTSDHRHWIARSGTTILHNAEPGPMRPNRRSGSQVMPLPIAEMRKASPIPYRHRPKLRSTRSNTLAPSSGGRTKSPSTNPTKTSFS